MNRDKYYMMRAIELARNGTGNVGPNPLVGCVIVKDNKVISEGFHARSGGPHAEIEALRKAGKKAKGATIYINLEPCCHWGKTPPCVDELTASGIKEVIVAMKDPNPLVCGKGLKTLKKAGIKVTVGLLQEEAMHLNRAFIKFITKRIPYVIIKAAMSLDGKIAISKGDSKWITCERSRETAHKIRSECDAVIVGSNTVIKDNPQLTSHGKGKNPMRVVITSKLDIPNTSKILDKTAPTVVVTGNNAPEKKVNSLRKRGIHVLTVKYEYGRIDLKEVLINLAKMDVKQVIVEGGGETNASFIEAGLADEILFFIAPKILGGRNSVTAVEGAGIQNIKDAWNVKDICLETIDTDILLRGYINSN